MVTAAPPVPLGEAFFARPAAEVAPALVGCTLLVEGVGGEIVETERYEQSDSAVDLIGGGYWWVNHKFTLRGGLGLGLADASPDWQLIFSGVWHF